MEIEREMIMIIMVIVHMIVYTIVYMIVYMIMIVMVICDGKLEGDEKEIHSLIISRID